MVLAVMPLESGINIMVVNNIDNLVAALFFFQSFAGVGKFF